MTPADFRRLAHGYVFDTARPQHGERESAHGACSGHENPVVHAGARQVDCVDGDGGRLGESGVARRERVGHPEQSIGLHTLVAAERPVPRREVGRSAFEAHCGAAARARPAVAASRARVGDDARSGFPHVARPGTFDHRPRPFVPEHVSCLGELLENEMQVRPADAARRDLYQNLVRPGNGHGQLLHLHPALAHVHRRRHRLRLSASPSRDHRS